jgi:hypothetical protein
MCIDLHTHSIYSDGTSTPEELVGLAVSNGLKGLSLTDHDTVEGVEEVKRLGEQAGLVVVSGVEISTTLRQYTLHILGYGIDHSDQALHRWLQPLQEGRKKRNDIILHKLQELGVEITAEEVQEISCCGQTGRPHIARLLMAKGVVDSFDGAFRQYLGRDRPAWESRFSYSAAETIDMIHQAGGLAVLAHPAQLDPEMRVQPLLIRELVLRGLDGLEIHYPTHTRKTKKKLKALAHEQNLLVTGGSDFHGMTRPAHRLAGKAMGFCPPCGLLDELTARLNRHQP